MERIEIEDYDKELQSRIKAGWDHVAKPLDSMGRFEEILSRIGAIQGKIVPELVKSRIIVCCADNGIVEEGVSQSGQEITAICAANIAGGRSSVAIMAKQTGTEILAVDVGIGTEKTPENVRDEKIRRGTRNFKKEPAMTPEEVQKALDTGMRLVKESKEQGYTILGIGEMGIGNTTTSSAVTAALLGLPVQTVTGRGAGLDDARFLHKQQVISEALEAYGLGGSKDAAADADGTKSAADADGTKSVLDATGTPNAAKAMDVLAKVGGLDIACMAGICIGAALYHVPVVLDGFISLAAALAACRIAPKAKEFLIASHSGKEPAMKAIEQELGLTPIIYANMALGEGTGAVLMLSLLRTANAVYEKSCSFETAGIGQYERFGDSGKV